MGLAMFTVPPPRGPDGVGIHAARPGRHGLIARKRAIPPQSWTYSVIYITNIGDQPLVPPGWKCPPGTAQRFTDMKRMIQGALRAWEASPRRKPLLLWGAR